MCRVKTSAKDRRPAEQAAACHVAGGWIQGVTDFQMGCSGTFPAVRCHQAAAVRV